MASPRVMVDRAIHVARSRFPFEGYMESAEDAYRNVARAVLKHLPPGGKILDFGCGPCDKTAVLQALGFVCSGYDDLDDDWHHLDGNRQKILSFARESGIDFRLADGGAFPFDMHSFDMIMMHGVLEHLKESPRDLLNDLLELLKPGGLLFVTVPNAVNIRKRIHVLLGRTNLPAFDLYYWSPSPWRGHIREYTKGDLLQLSRNLGLHVLELRGCHHMLRKIPQALRPAFRVLTAVFSGWRDSWVLVARKPPDWRPKKTLPPEQLTRILGKYRAYRD